MNINKQIRDYPVWINLGRRENGDRIDAARARPRSGFSLWMACGRESQDTSVARAEGVRRGEIIGGQVLWDQ